MTCSQSELLIQHALDGRLTPPQRARLDAHLDRCPACRASWAEARALVRATDAWARPSRADDPGEDFTARVMAHVAQRPPPPPILGERSPLWRNADFPLRPPQDWGRGGPLLALLLLTASLAAGPWVGAHLPAPTPALHLPHPAPAIPDLPTTGRLILQGIAQAWCDLPSVLRSPRIGGGGGLWATLAAAFALNALFALRTRAVRKSVAR